MTGPFHSIVWVQNSCVMSLGIKWHVVIVEYIVPCPIGWHSIASGSPCIKGILRVPLQSSMHKPRIWLQTFSIDRTVSFRFAHSWLSPLLFFLFKVALLIRTSANKFGSWVGGHGAGYTYLNFDRWLWAVGLTCSHPHMAGQIHASLVHVMKHSKPSP